MQIYEKLFTVGCTAFIVFSLNLTLVKSNIPILRSNRIFMKNGILIFAISWLFIACNSSENADPDAKVYSQIKKAYWLIGMWENNDEQSDYYEFWQHSNDSTIVGETYLIVELDTIFGDSMSISEKNGGLFYSKSSKFQDRKSYTDLGLTSSADGRLIFENPKNTFPNKIIYKKIGRDSVEVSNIGMRNNEEFSESYSFKKNNLKK